jgi:hypothetical protein
VERKVELGEVHRNLCVVGVHFGLLGAQGDLFALHSVLSHRGLHLVPEKLPGPFFLAIFEFDRVSRALTAAENL